jgi:hypothetical protein
VRDVNQPTFKLTAENLGSMKYEKLRLKSLLKSTWSFHNLQCNPESLFLEKKKKNRLHYLFPIIMDLGLPFLLRFSWTLNSQATRTRFLRLVIYKPIFDPCDFFLFIHKIHQILFYFFWFVSISTSRPNSKGDLFPLISWLQI